MILVDEGKLDLGKPVSAFLPELPRRDRGQGHGLAPPDPLVGPARRTAALQGDRGQGRLPRAHLAMDLVYEPGTKSVYSDLGVILLGEILERVAGEALEAFARRRVLRAARDEGHDVPSRPRAPPAHRAHRERPLARTTAAGRGARRERLRPRRDRAARRPLRHRARPRALRPDAAQRRRLRAAPHRVARDAWSASREAAGRPGLEPRARLGHADASDKAERSSAPGTPPTRRPDRSCPRARSATPASPAPRSGWIPSASLFVILLTNRVHPTPREQRDPRGARAPWPTRWCAAFSRSGPCSHLSPPLCCSRPRRCGSVWIVVLEADGGKPLVGKRLGLVAHAASVTADGRHAVDVLRGLQLDLKRLFAPEHGLAGNAAAGEIGGERPRSRERSSRREPLRRASGSPRAKTCATWTRS